MKKEKIANRKSPSRSATLAEESKLPASGLVQAGKHQSVGLTSHLTFDVT